MGSNQQDQIKMVEFLKLISKLKHIKRTAWIELEEEETIYGRISRMAAITAIIQDINVDRTKCMQLALIHDLAESRFDDVEIPLVEFVEEGNTVKFISSLTGYSVRKIYEFYKEYEDNCTPESKFIKEIDKLDSLLRAFEYEKKIKSPLRFQDLFDSMTPTITHPSVKKIINSISKQRNLHIINCKKHLNL